MENNWLANILEKIGDVLEMAETPVSNLISLAVPYISAIAMAELTKSNLIKYYDMDLTVAKYVTLSLEGISIIAISSFVYVLSEWIKTRNKKFIALVYLLGFVIVLYLATIIGINVVLESSNGASMSHIAVSVFLSFITVAGGIVYGYFKNRKDINKEKDEQKEQAEKLRLEAKAEKQRKWDIKHGVAPTQAPAMVLQATTPAVSMKKSDWRLLTLAEKKAVKNMSAKEISNLYQVGESTAFLWKNKSKTL